MSGQVVEPLQFVILFLETVPESFHIIIVSDQNTMQFYRLFQTKLAKTSREGLESEAINGVEVCVSGPDEHLRKYISYF